jgi:hypothetical protein
VTDLDVGVVETALAGLVARDLVRPAAASTTAGDAEYLFWHALIRDVAYGQLPRKARARQHLAAGRWIEARAGERAGEVGEILVHHYDSGLLLARAAGDAELEAALLPAAQSACMLAGQHALALDAAAAERYFARATELAPASSRERLRALLRWGEALYGRGLYHEAAAALREASDGLQVAGEVRAAAEALCMLANVLPWMGEPTSQVMRAAVDLLADDGPSREQVRVLALSALGLAVEGREPREVMDMATRSIAASAALGLPSPPMAVGCRGSARLELGDPDGLAEYEQALAMAEEQELGLERIGLEMNHAGFVLMMRGARASYQTYADAEERARRRGLTSFAVNCRAGRVAMLYLLGDWNEALAETAIMVPEMEAAGDLWDALTLRTMEMSVHVRRGDPGEAASTIDWVEAKGRENEAGWTRAEALLAVALVRSALGESEAASRLLAEAFAVDRPTVLPLEDVLEAVRLALHLGDDALAGRIALWYEAGAPGRRVPMSRYVLESADGLLAETRGGFLEAAAAGFAAAASGWSAFDMPFEEGHALLGQGRCLVALGRAPEAAAPLAAAREIFARLGARPALAETDEWLARPD